MSGSMTELLHSSLGNPSKTPGAYSGTTAQSSLGSDLYMNGHNLGSQTPSDYNSHSTPLWSPFNCNDDYPNSVANNSTLMLSQVLLQALTCIFSKAKIQQISEQDLIIVQNPTFMHIYAENVTLKIRADSIEKAYNELVASCRTMPHVQTEELREPTPEEPEGYPDIDYWYKHDQLDERKQQEEFKSNNRATGDSRQGPRPETDDNVAFWHFQHEDGTVLDGEEIRKIRKEAKIQWKLLSDKYGDIGSLWMTVSPTPQLDFCLRMEDKFPLLCLCDDHYKALTIAYADYSHWYLKWVKSKVKCKCPCKCGARSKTKSKSKGKSKSPSKFKYKYTSPPKYKSKSKYKSEDEEEDKDETESEVAPQKRRRSLSSVLPRKSQHWEGTTRRVSKMQEESKDDDMEDNEGQDDSKEDKEDEEVDNNNNNNSKSDKGDSSDDADADGDNDLDLIDPPPNPLYLSQSAVTSSQLCKSLQEVVYASQTQPRPHTTQAAASSKGKSMPRRAPSVQTPSKAKVKARPAYAGASRKEKSKTTSNTPEGPPAPIVNPTAPAPSNDTRADTTNFNPNPLANAIRTTPPASAPENMDTREDKGPDRQRNSGSNNSNAPPMALPSKAPTPTPDSGAPDARTSMAPPSKAPTPAPDAGAPDARTSMVPPSKAPTPIPIRGTSESRCVSAAPSNNAPTPGPSGSVSDSRRVSVAPPSNAPTPGPSGSVSESGSGTNSNMSREGKAKAKKPVPMRPGKVKTTRNLYTIDYLKVHSVTREEFAKVWVNLDEATKEIYKQREMDVKSTTKSSSA
ncbi:hypothetical protein EI94DRAFT_1706264 [Lactarius quietus]|nr:hypothetical protein EI94DRAFT_1706264 [Lactarius quietus]